MKAKRYITTKRNLIFREGISVEFTKGTFVHEPYYDKEEKVIRVHDAELDFYVHNKGYIKEVEEKEFTRTDLIEICYIRFGGDKDCFINNLNPVIDEFLAQRLND